MEERDAVVGGRPTDKQPTRTREERLLRRARRKQRVRQSTDASPSVPSQEASTSRSPRRLNAIAKLIGAKSYLEIGVSTGRTFVSVDVPHKVAVDPRFRFDVAAHQAPGLHFHQTTSDEFFEKHPRSEKFDLIFLDGLHVFGQTLRDFRNAIEVAHEGTVFLIDDVVPMDEFSALPDQRGARQARLDATGVRRKGWHGDVYKVIFAIHDLHPEFSFVTIESGDNPQTIVWRKRRENVVPVFGTVEAVDKIDYAEFVRQKVLFNIQPEAAALQMLAATVKSATPEKP
jgi:predicted O-methyltransferase YrrM